VRIALLAVPLGIAVLAGVSSTTVLSMRGSPEPAPLRGVPLRGPTGLRLLVADNPPFVLDVDSGRVSPLSDFRRMKGGTLSIVGVGGRGAVVVAQAVWRHADLYAVRGREARVSALGTGAAVVAAADGRSVWVKSFRTSQCTLRRLGLDGRVLRPPRASRCASTIYAAARLGLVVNRTRVVDPRSGRTVRRTRWGIVAAAGRTLILAGPGDLFTVVRGDGTERRLPRPRIVAGLDASAVDPSGRFVALAFADPAWRGGAQQALDLWVFDTESGRLTHVPGMPAFVSLKFTSAAWTRDGRLVLLGESGGGDVVALWRPGEKHISVKTVQLPERGEVGSDSFAVLS
jgi:hypothetical protein